jgi:hypothetical protein
LDVNFNRNHDKEVNHMVNTTNSRPYVSGNAAVKSIGATGLGCVGKRVGESG